MEKTTTIWFSIVTAFIVLLGSLGQILPGLILLLLSFLYPPFTRSFFGMLREVKPLMRFFTRISFSFFAWAVVATAVSSPTNLVSWGIVIGLFIVIFPLFFAGSIATKLNLRFLHWVFVSGGFLATGYIYYDAYILGHTRAGLLVGCNAAGTLLLIALAVFLTSYFKEKTTLRPIYLLGGLLSAGGILLTASRAAWVGAATMLFFMLIFGTRNKKLLIAIVCGILLLGIIIVGDSYLKNRFLTIFDLENNSVRLDTYKIATEMMKGSFFGIGLGNFEDEHLRYLPEGKNPLSHAHNIYLHFGAELGYAGFILAVVMYLTVPWMCVRISRSKPYFIPVGAGFMAILVRELFDSTTLGLSVAGFLWFIMGFIYATYIQQEKLL